MSSNYWIKLYHEILDDPKMGRLSDHAWRRTIELFLIAGESGNGGFLPPVEDIAWRLRTSVDDVTAILQELETVGITSQTDDGWLVCNFATRQDKISNADRQRKYRNRQHKQTYYGNEPRNEDVTTRNTDKDKDKDTDKESTATAARPEIFKIYEREIGALTPMIADALMDAEKIYPHEWFTPAFQEAADHNARSWKYVEAVLKRWANEGFKSDKKPKPNGKSPPARPGKKQSLAEYLQEHKDDE